MSFDRPRPGDAPIDDHGPDSLMAPSERLLAWWTDRRQDVEQAFAAGA
jgi:homoserine kinase type II